MGGVDTIADPGIPSIMLSYEDCQTIRMDLDNGLNGTIEVDQSVPFDSDLDAGIICHEYGHGISIRLTGGPSTNACLGNGEQQGEGWSDFFGLVLTQQPGDQHDMSRGIGTYVLGQGTSGGGIRPAPYTSDMVVNPYTYDDIDQVSQPHGVGFVWCSMIWDMTWALDNHFGHEDDIYADSSDAGNIVAYNLVMEGLKLQNCNPGFVDARDAILLADTMLYSGQHSCIIWNAFARRGLGFGADQGNENNRSDGLESYDVPSSCSLLSYEDLFVNGPLLPPCGGDNLVIDGTLTQDSIYSARLSLESTAIVPAQIDATFRAGEQVELVDGFTVDSAATLQIYIEPCRD